MTVEQVRNGVELIKKMTGDNEMAHSAEDALWADVLRAIAQGSPSAQQLAAEALQTLKVTFRRWYA